MKIESGRAFSVAAGAGVRAWTVRIFESSLWYHSESDSASDSESDEDSSEVNGERADWALSVDFDGARKSGSNTGELDKEVCFRMTRG